MCLKPILILRHKDLSGGHMIFKFSANVYKYSQFQDVISLRSSPKRHVCRFFVLSDGHSLKFLREGSIS